MVCRVHTRYHIGEAVRPILLVNHLEPTGLEYSLGDPPLISTLLNNVGGVVVLLW